MTDGFAPTRDVHIAAISTVPLGHTTIAPVFARRLAIVVVTTNARLAEIIESRPHDITYDIRIVVHECPVLESITRIALGLPHHTLRISLMIASMLEYHIIISADIQHVEVRVIDFPISVPGTERLSHGASGVIIQNSLLQQLSGVDHADVLALDDLIADAPADDTRMVAVALHHRTDILLIARVNQRRIVIGFLGRAPSVESLADHQHAE